MATIATQETIDMHIGLGRHRRLDGHIGDHIDSVMRSVATMHAHEHAFRKKQLPCKNFNERKAFIRRLVE